MSSHAGGNRSGAGTKRNSELSELNFRGKSAKQRREKKAAEKEHQDALDSIIREAIQAARAAERKANQRPFSRAQERIIFNEHMKSLTESPKAEHWEKLETLYKSQSDYVQVFPKLRSMLENHYTKWNELNRELSLIRKRHHAKWKETQELALTEDSHYSNWTAAHELKDGVNLEGWGRQFFPTSCDQL